MLKNYIFKQPHETIKQIVNEQLPSELRLYLIKMAQTIFEICQGDIVIEGKFYNDLVKTILPSLIINKESFVRENSLLQSESKLDET